MNIQYLRVEDKVKVVNSLLYTGRTGILKPISDDPEDTWDHYVLLDDVATDKVHGRVIGVLGNQVIPI